MTKTVIRWGIDQAGNVSNAMLRGGVETDQNLLLGAEFVNGTTTGPATGNG